MSQNIFLRLVHEGGEFRQAGLHLVDHLAPLDSGGVLSSCAKMGNYALEKPRDFCHIAAIEKCWPWQCTVSWPLNHVPAWE